MRLATSHHRARCLPVPTPSNHITAVRNPGRSVRFPSEFPDTPDARQPCEHQHGATRENYSRSGNPASANPLKSHNRCPKSRTICPVSVRIPGHPGHSPSVRAPTRRDEGKLLSVGEPGRGTRGKITLGRGTRSGNPLGWGTPRRDEGKLLSVGEPRRGPPPGWLATDGRGGRVQRRSLLFVRDKQLSERGGVGKQRPAGR